MIIHDMPVGRFKGERLFVLTEQFRVYSDVLQVWFTIPAGFTCDLETMLFIRGLCREGGLIHDYFSRIDSEPIVTQKVAANVYRETLQYFGHPAWKVSIKYWAVRFAAGYFHKKKVLDA